MTDARVILWGRDIGAVSWLPDREVAVFQYAPEFTGSGIEVAPLMMPLRDAPYEFPSLPHEAFKGLPGLLADSLPDKFGNALIDSWLASRGRRPESFNPVERLCYIGTRGMGAIEFQPAIVGPASRSRRLEHNKRYRWLIAAPPFARPTLASHATMRQLRGIAAYCAKRRVGAATHRSSGPGFVQLSSD